ncbi:transcription factor TAF5p [Cryptosporidium canis]|uniref:Transcription factor TAF5p n=1 Tax=Cryptosporidium canis TaxID=195482 RepID=A0ABQ8P540_9CRYT|nr:transcription factor TAF5p [Cryptosporidium canis]KAJ1612259.1 transcription factor TAF5p [Cryptosporidium canis]
MSNQQYPHNSAFQTYTRQIPSQSQNSSEQMTSQSSGYSSQMSNGGISLTKTIVPQTQSSLEKSEQGISNVIKYLRKNGYIETLDTLLFEMNSHNKKLKKEPLDGEMVDSEVDRLINFTQKLDKISAQVLSEKYSKFRNWVLNSLSSIREELISVCFVVFINICAILHRHSTEGQYRDFLNRFWDDFSLTKYREIVMLLRSSNNLDQLKNVEALKPFFKSKFHITLSQTSISMLSNYLLSYCDTLVIGILQEKLVIHVFDHKINSKIIAPAGDSDDLNNLSQVQRFQIGELYSEDTLTIELNSKNKQKGSKYSETSLVPKEAPKIIETDMAGKGYSQDSTIINWGLLPENYSGIISKENEVKKSKSERFDSEITEEIKTPIEVDMNPMNDSSNSFTFMYKKQLYEDISNRKFVDSNHLPSIICSSLECLDQTEIIDMNISHNHEFGAFCTDDGRIQVFDIEDQKSKIEPIWIHRNRVQCIRFHPWSPEFLLSAGIDCMIKLSVVTKYREESTLNQLVTFNGNSTNCCIWDICWDDYGISFISGSSDRAARLWCTSRTYPIRIFTGHLGDVRSVSIHPNSSITATGASDNQIIIWDVRTGKREGRIHNPNVTSGVINQVKFSHSGYLLASSSIHNALPGVSSKNTLKVPIWDIRKLCNTGRATQFYQLCKFPNEIFDSNEQVFVKSLDFSFGSRILASVTNNGIVSVWDTNVETSFNQMDHSNANVNSTQIYKLANSSSKSLKFLSRNLLSVSSVRI